MSRHVGPAALMVAAVAVMSSCRQSPRTGTTGSSPTGGQRSTSADRTAAATGGSGLPTGSWTTDGPWSAALLQGMLVAGRDGCIYVRSGTVAASGTPDDDARLSLMVWPAGFTAVGSFQDGLVVLDPDGHEVARTGEYVDLMGGGGDRGLLPGIEHCTDHPGTLTFMGGLSPRAPG